MNAELSKLAEILHRENCSCVISKDGQITICNDRGVNDLYRILCDSPEVLNHALIADKVIGKGAAALMILGKVKEIYADVISQLALKLLNSENIPVSYMTSVPNIINRKGTGICPVESLCRKAITAKDCLPLITGFINNTNKLEN